MVMWTARGVNPFQQLRREMDRLLSSFAGDGSELPWAAAASRQPAVNMWETSDAVCAELEVPGLKANELDLSVVGNQLTIKIERSEAEEEGVTYHRRERPAGSFVRVLRLPAEVDPGRVAADLKDGVLTVRLPKAEAARPRKIQVTAK